jgi:CheY-like chemotaxis protein
VTTTLLAVDDSKTMRKVMEITFAGEGFKTVVAADAADAVAKAQSEHPQVALIDAALDGTNGYDLCKQIKGASPSTVVVLLSNKAQPYDKARGAAAGADDFMDKPFDTQQMIDKVTLLAKRGVQAAVAPVAVPPPAVAPVVAVPLAAKPPEAQRQRVQTLAYGSTPVPPQVTASAPSPVIPSKPLGGSSPFGSRAPTTPGTPAYSPPAPVAAPAPMAAASNGVNADFASKLGGLGLSQAQIEGVLSLSREVVEKVVWEVVPTLAEVMIKEEIARLTRD